jgi:opacity protein-like surface antigen
MKKYLLAAVAALALAAPAMASDMTCSITDNAGNELAYNFVPFAHNPDPSQGPTYLESGMMKNNRPVDVGLHGDFPVWSWRVGNGFATLMMKNNRPVDPNQRRRHDAR